MRGPVAILLAAISYGLLVHPLGAEELTPDQETVPRASVGETVHQGNALFMKGDLEGAFRHYQEALKGAVGEDQAKVHYNLANTFLRLGRFEDAKKEYQEALRIDPKNEDSKYNLEMAYLTRGGTGGVLRPQAEIEGASEQLDEQVLRILQTLEKKEFGFPKGVPQPPTPPEPESKREGKDW